MRIHIRVIFALVAVMLGASTGASSAQTQKAGTLIILATGFEHNDGQVGVNLFAKPDDLFDHPTRQVYAKITDGRAEIVIPHLPYGNYALVVFHDENMNGNVDHNLFRFPSEPLGYPNGYRFGLKQGLPNFEKLQIRFSESSPPLNITVH